MPILLYAGAAGLLLYLAKSAADSAGEAAREGADLTRSLVLLLAVGLGAVYVPRLLK